MKRAFGFLIICTLVFLWPQALLAEDNSVLSIAQSLEIVDFEVDSPHPDSDLVVSVHDFGASPDARDNYDAFQRAINYAIENRAAEIKVPKGVYRFAPPQTLRIAKAKDLVIDGEGSELIFSQICHFIEIVGCERLVFKNFCIDWDWGKEPLASVGKVVDVNNGRLYFDMEFLGMEKVNPAWKFQVWNAMDPDTLTPGTEGGKEFWPQFDRIEQITPNTLRFHPMNIASHLSSIGEVYRIRHRVYDAHAVLIGDTNHLTLDNIIIYSAPGHGYWVHGDTHHLEIVNSKITLRPGSSRRITVTADGIHFGQSQGYFRMVGNDFGFGGDDCLNIHDNISMGIRVLDDKTLIAENVYQWRNPFQAGDLVEIRQPDLSPTGFSSTLERVSYNHPAAQVRLTFADTLPVDLDENSILFNRRYDSSNFVIKDNYFHQNRARGILLQAGNGLVEGNTFYRNQGAAIQIEGGAESRWAEGMGVSNLVIRDNMFDTCDVNDWRKGVVYVSTYLPTGPTDYPMFRNLLFEENTFIDVPRRAVIVRSAENVVIRANTFKNPTTRKRNNYERSTIKVELSSNIVVADNTWVESPYIEYIEVDADNKTVKGLVETGNSIVGEL